MESRFDGILIPGVGEKIDFCERPSSSPRKYNALQVLGGTMGISNLLQILFPSQESANQFPTTFPWLKAQRGKCFRVLELVAETGLET
jgi:hypothetical protein